jgi:hypothetical protein
MLGDTSEFGPLDLLGSLAVNAATTRFACQSPTLRYGLKVKGDVPAYADFRFLGGVAAAAAGQFINDPTARRVGHDLATGLLGSYVATEMCRSKAIANADAAAAAAAPAQIPAEQPTGRRAAAPAEGGAKNYVYGW